MKLLPRFLAATESLSRVRTLWLKRSPLQVVPGLRSAVPRPWPVGSKVCQQQGSGRKPKHMKNDKEKDLEAIQ
jgi:hypothetical protein